MRELSLGRPKGGCSHLLEVPSNRGDTTMVELSLGWPKGGCLIPFYLIFRDFDYWLLNRRWPLNRWQLNEGSTVYQPPANCAKQVPFTSTHS